MNRSHLPTGTPSGAGAGPARHLPPHTAPHSAGPDGRAPRTKKEKPGMAQQHIWSGQWVTDRLGIALDGDAELAGLLGLALRRNPKRAHLLVSNVLGKHVPQRPDVVHGAGVALGRRVRALLGDAAASAVVLGYAETATGLGHSVADGLELAPYLHSTRRPVPGLTPYGGFEESHSHATSHLLLPEDPGLLLGDGPLVLVDDEFSTGNTVLNTIESLHRRKPRTHYVIVALVDMRSAADRGRLDAFARTLGARVDLVTAATGTLRLPEDVLARGTELVARHESASPGPAAEPETAVPGGTPAAASRVDLGWPTGLPDGGRHGWTPAHRDGLESALPTMAARIGDRLGDARRVLVLGFEELMYTPLRLAGALDATSAAEISFSTTTRSPVLAVDDPGYAIRTRIAFPAHDDPADGPGTRYAYNVAAGSDPGRRFDAVVLIADSAADTPELHAPGGLLDRLAAHTDRVLLAVVPSYVPMPRERTSPGPLRGPAFSSYEPDDVGWLLQDLSDVRLEAPTEDRKSTRLNSSHRSLSRMPSSA